MTPDQNVLQVVNVSKHFGGLVAVSEVNLAITAGEVVGLLGDNGAGKSTLIKVISGVYRPSSGQIFMQGTPVSFDSPADAQRQGIETIYQDLALCENLNASANIFLGREPVRRWLGVLPTVNRSFMQAEAQQVLAQLNIVIPDLRRPIRQMSGGQRQAVAIARAVYWNARLVIMDEPTAALGVPEQRKVLEIVQALRERGVPVIIITHNMHDVFAITDRVIVMRRGRNVGERLTGNTTSDELVSLMVGAERMKKAETTGPSAITDLL